MIDVLTSPAEVAQRFKLAMRRMAATITIITTTDQKGCKHGMTATAVSSVSMDPPTLLICVSRTASIHDPLLRHGGFCVNVLSTAHEELVGAFGGRMKGQDRFNVGAWKIDERTQLPYLANAQSNVLCEISNVVQEGTHSIVFGRVLSTLVEEAVTPLLYADGSLAEIRLR